MFRDEPYSESCKMFADTVNRDAEGRTTKHSVQKTTTGRDSNLSSNSLYASWPRSLVRTSSRASRSARLGPWSGGWIFLGRGWERKQTCGICTTTNNNHHYQNVSFMPMCLRLCMTSHKYILCVHKELYIYIYVHMHEVPIKPTKVG